MPSDDPNDRNGGDLDAYLENIGIDLDGDSEPPLPQDHDLEAPLPVPGVVRDEGTLRDRTESFLVNLLLNFDPSFAVEVREIDETEVSAEIFGGDAGKIIGRGGKTLAALEYITNAVMNRSDGVNQRVNIDVGGYKRRRDDRLRALAASTAEKVRKHGEPIALDPMSAAERRVIHVALVDDPSVTSESTGKGRDRRVVIRPS